MEETKSNWSCVADYMDGQKEIRFGRYVSYWYLKTPGRFLHHMSYYKFAAKLIGNGKKVLDIGCNEGTGTYLLSKECGYAKGVDFDEEAIQSAKNNYESENICFSSENVLETQTNQQWDAVVNFDVIEHIFPENSDDFIKSMADSIKPEGMVVIGTPSLISQEFASEISKKGHVNIYSHERLEAQMRKFFDIVFIFAANDEVVHTGYLPLAHYFIAVGCKKK
ncbi:MAG: class I SAM-dependent methyltransferase [Chlamydiae bacterium]|nr:class I SAM-dependent methyltransferase [Chlamydiota bacterium]